MQLSNIPIVVERECIGKYKLCLKSEECVTIGVDSLTLYVEIRMAQGVYRSSVYIST